LRAAYDPLAESGEVPLAREQRRLAAIIAADVVGYSRLMGRDETGTLQRLREHRRNRLEPVLRRFGGRVVKFTGDGALVEFASAVDALSAAIELQQATEDINRDKPDDEAIVFRIGLHVGDLIVDGDDLYGDGVNIAARLETEAPPGGIVISLSVRDAVSGRVKATFEDLGRLTLKNIERPLRAFRVGWRPDDWRLTEADASAASTSLALPDRPSIAVMPFQNISGDPQQEYFADGMVEDIITALSRFKSLFVIARNASFTYKGRVIDIKQVGRELGVRYVLEGSVRRAADKIRITGQLIDVETRTNLWADQFDGSIEDVFALQDQVATHVAARIAPKVGHAEIERTARKPVNSLDAYDCYLRALAVARGGTLKSCQEALQLCDRAITLDPGFAAPYGLAALCYAVRKSNLWTDNPSTDVAETRRLVSHVTKIAGDDALALSRAGWSLAIVCDEVEDGAALIDLGLLYNPNLAVAWTNRGMVSVLLGQHEAAIEQLNRARRLSPIGSATARSDTMMAYAYLFMGDSREAISWASKVLRAQPNLPGAIGAAAIANALVGNIEEARQLVDRLRELAPSMSLRHARELSHLRRPEDFERFVKGLRIAGMPE
jgi:TolB-like protein/class 3 adenylate cyclase